MAHFATLGLLSLENRHIVIGRNGGRLALAGITDRASRRTGRPVRDLAAVLEGVPKGVPVILLDRQPSDTRATPRSSEWLCNSLDIRTADLFWGSTGWPRAP